LNLSLNKFSPRNIFLNSFRLYFFMVSGKTFDEIDSAKEKENVRLVEAVFFVSGRFLNMQELVSLSDLNPMVIADVLAKLKERYEKVDSALEIVEKNGLWKMDVRSEYTGIINKLATGSVEFTSAEQETLAIIAFKQPMKQSVIIKIRGNKAYDHIKKFVDLNLIRKKKEGHTYELTLSDEFYDYFKVDLDNPLQKEMFFEEDSDDEKGGNSNA
jgi:segregation and condensation protein B